MFDLTNRESVLSTLAESSLVSDIHQEDPANDVALAECALLGALSPEELNELSENSKELEQLESEGLISEATKTIIKFNKKDQMKRATAQAVLIIAKEKNDRDFNKLVRVWKMRKALLTKLDKKYHSQAVARAKQMVKNMNKSKSASAKKVAKRTA